MAAHRDRRATCSMGVLPNEKWAHRHDRIGHRHPGGRTGFRRLGPQARHHRLLSRRDGGDHRRRLDPWARDHVGRPRRRRRFRQCGSDRRWLPSGNPPQFHRETTLDNGITVGVLVGINAENLIAVDSTTTPRKRSYVDFRGKFGEIRFGEYETAMTTDCVGDPGNVTANFGVNSPNESFSDAGRGVTFAAPTRSGRASISKPRSPTRNTMRTVSSRRRSSMTRPASPNRATMTRSKSAAVSPSISKKPSLVL
jgi:hypothetical protein